MNILRVGTDCSGIEAPIQALMQMNITFEHVFSSEIDKYCIKSIKANYNPEIIFGQNIHNIVLFIESFTLKLTVLMKLTKTRSKIFI